MEEPQAGYSGSKMVKMLVFRFYRDTLEEMKESVTSVNEIQATYMSGGAAEASRFVETQIHSLVDGALDFGLSVRTLSKLMGNALRDRMPQRMAAGHATADEGLESLLEIEGGCVDVSEARHLFRKPGGVTRQALATQIRNGNVLAYRSGGGDYLVPVWQFRREGGVVAGLPEVLAGIREKLDAESPLTAFAFLLQAHPLTGGKPPLEALRAGRLADVLAAVEADAR